MKLKVIFHYTPCLAGGLLPTKYRKQGKLKLPFIFIVDKLMRRLSTQDQKFKQVFAELLAFETVSDPELLKTVDQIIADIRQHGDTHVLKPTQQFARHPAH